MSGTSLDGIDLAEIFFEIVDRQWTFDITVAETVPYSSFWRGELRNAINYSREQLERLDFKFTEKLSEELSKFIRKHNI